MKIFQYSTTSSLKKSTATNYFDSFVTPHPSRSYLQFFFSEGKHRAYSGSNGMLKPEYCDSTLYIIYIAYVTYVSDGLVALCETWGGRLPQYLKFSFQQYHHHLAH